jgi:hypothetical protein
LLANNTLEGSIPDLSACTKLVRVELQNNSGLEGGREWKNDATKHPDCPIIYVGQGIFGI